jgi:hypothetical protein
VIRVPPAGRRRWNRSPLPESQAASRNPPCAPPTTRAFEEAIRPLVLGTSHIFSCGPEACR